MADTSLVVCGEAGQGIQSIEYALMHITKKAGYYNFATKEYMSRIRGGSNSTEFRFADHPISAFVNRIDILILLSPHVFSHIENRINPKTIIIGSLDNNQLSNQNLAIDFSKVAQNIGSILYTSAVAIGFVLRLLNIEAKFYAIFFAELYEAKSKELVEKNILAAAEGYKLADIFLTKQPISTNITPNSELANKIQINGSEALAFGAIAGGCNFIAAYPMSPSTGVLNQLAILSHEFDIVVEQAEDEIAAINMTLGAWYAGARGLVTTSGGGFALMCEGLSLAGMTETPIVISLGQRPGPATGLPTRTEQGDLNLALYAGHGEFPRVIFAPGNVTQAFYLMQKAFVLADNLQIPAIILSDQFLVDSFFISEKLDPTLMQQTTQAIIKTPIEYKRYELTANGISPRGIPDFGEAIVCVDSDEHTPEGYITEDFNLRSQMVEKRLKKLELLAKEIVAPELLGDENYQTLMITWGSNYEIIKEALAATKATKIACLHFSQVYPLAKELTKYFSQAKKIIVIENNATGQFAQLLKQNFGINIDQTVLKYNGMPFALEEIIDVIEESAYGK